MKPTPRDLMVARAVLHWVYRDDADDEEDIAALLEPLPEPARRVKSGSVKECDHSVGYCVGARGEPCNEPAPAEHEPHKDIGVCGNIPTMSPREVWDSQKKPAEHEPMTRFAARFCGAQDFRLAIKNSYPGPAEELAAIEEWCRAHRDPELAQETRTAEHEQAAPAAWLVRGGRVYRDRAMIGEDAARRDAAKRGDGSVVVPLYCRRPAEHEHQPSSEAPINPACMQSFDARDWASDFRATAKSLGYCDMDQGWLIGWFANAIMRGFDEANRRHDAEHEQAARDAKRMFPLQAPRRGQEIAPHPLSIPWAVAEKAYCVYASRYGRSQTLERIAERGGFGGGEMDDLYPAWRDEVSAIAAARADGIKAERERCARIAEAHDVGAAPKTSQELAHKISHAIRAQDEPGGKGE